MAGLGQGRLAAVCHGPRPAGTFTTWVEERQRLGRAQGPRDGKGATELERRRQLVRTGGDRADRLDTPESSTAAEGPVWAGRAQSAGRTRAPRLREPHAASREPERSAWAEKPPRHEGEARHGREATPRGAGALVDVVTLTRADTDDAQQVCDTGAGHTPTHSLITTSDNQITAGHRWRERAQWRQGRGCAGHRTGPQSPPSHAGCQEALSARGGGQPGTSTCERGLRGQAGAAGGLTPGCGKKCWGLKKNADCANSELDF